MAVVWPSKNNFANGDVLTATNMNNIGDTLNVFNPTSATNGQVLTANGAGSVSYASLPASGGWTSLASGNLSGLSSLDLTSISASYKNLHLQLIDYSTSANAILYFRYNNLSSSSYYGYVYGSNGTGTGFVSRTYGAQLQGELSHVAVEATQVDNFLQIDSYAYTNTTSHKVFQFWTKYGYVGNYAVAMGELSYDAAVTAVSRLTVYPASGTFDNGTYVLYGEN